MAIFSIPNLHFPIHMAVSLYLCLCLQISLLQDISHIGLGATLPSFYLSAMPPFLNKVTF